MDDVVNNVRTLLDDPDLIRLLLAAAGAIVSYLISAFPEEDRIRTKLKQLFPNSRPATIERWVFLVLILLGTLVVRVILHPQTHTEAFLAGFGWISLLTGFTKERDKPPPPPNRPGPP